MQNTNRESSIAQLKMLPLMEHYGFEPVSITDDRYQYKCPLHDEQHGAAFAAYLEPGRGWHCFGKCDDGGDPIKFIMEFEQVGFIRALEIAEGIYGVKLARSNEDKSRNQQLDLIGRFVDGYHAELLKRPDLLDYLHQKRGITLEAVKRHKLGYAPHHRDTWLPEPEEFALSVEVRALYDDGGMYVPRLLNRIVVPIHNAYGEIISLTGRLNPLISYEHSTAPKWLHLSNSDLRPNMGITVPGWHPDLQKDIKRYDGVVIVEGLFDALSLQCAGIPAVAAVGLNIGEAIQRLSKNLILFLDDDEAGRQAIYKIAPGLFESIERDPSVAVRVAFPPNGLDPDEYVVRDADGCKQTLAQAVNLSDYVVAQIIAEVRAVDSPADRLRAINQYPKLLAALPQGIKRPYLTQIAAATGLDLSDLMPEPEPEPESQAEPTSTDKTALLRIEDSDDGYAGFLHQHAGDRFLYALDAAASNGGGNWFYWTGEQWVDHQDEAETRIRDLIRLLKTRYQELSDDLKNRAITAHDEDERGRLLAQSKRAQAIQIRLGSVRQKTAILTALQDRAYRDNSGKAVYTSQFDTSSHLLLTSNHRVIDLRTGRTAPNRRDYYLTRATHAAYDPQAQCPVFMKYLDKITQGDVDYAQFLQLIVGYALYYSGSVKHLFILHGPSNTAKSTFLRVIAHMLGDKLAQSVGANVLMASSYENSERRLTVEQMQNRRFFYVSETKLDQTFDSTFVKNITGGDSIRGRGHGKQFIDVTVGGPFLIATNEAPQINTLDRALVERLCILPFHHVFGANERDDSVERAMRDEASGILNWAAAGAVQFHNHGFPPKSQWPEPVRAATTGLITDSDPIQRFMDEMVEVSHGETLRQQDLYDVYVIWMGNEGYRTNTERKSFYTHLENLGYSRKKTGGYCKFVNIRFRTSSNEQ